MVVEIFTNFLGNSFTGVTGWFALAIESAFEQVPILTEFGGGEILLLVSLLGLFLMTFKIQFFVKLIQIGLIIISIVAFISFLMY
jgi:hypothetical protein